MTTHEDETETQAPFPHHSCMLFALVMLGFVVIFVASLQFLANDSPASSTGESDDLSKGSPNRKEDRVRDNPKDEAPSTNELTTKDGMVDDGNWRCACEGGFLPPGLLKTFGGAEAVMRLGSGQCYHKNM